VASIDSLLKALWQPPVGSYKYLVFVCILCIYIVFAYWK